MKRYILSVLMVFSLVVILPSCDSEPEYYPKPRCYPKIEYPERAYQKFTENYCDFTFEYPKYAEVVQDTSYFDSKPIHPCWYDIHYPAYDARIHFSYYEIDKKNTFDKLMKDAHNLAEEHIIRADYIDDFPLRKPNGVSGFVFSIDGPSASPFQFYLTDSTTHFLRGSVYFKTQSRPDSLAPLINLVKEDAMHLINTFEWE